MQTFFARRPAFLNALPAHRPSRWLSLLLLSVWVTGCASLPREVDRPVSSALANPETTRIGQAVAARAATAGTRNDSGFALVGSAELAFTSRMTLIRAAQKTLDIQYYAILADDTTERMSEALREAAARGVRIRILLDDFNTSGKNARILKLAFEPNIEFRLFNPLPGGRGALFLRILSNLKDVARMQRRMHNKIFVADNAVAIVGGRNLGETYFGQSEGTNFVDIDVLAAGRIARDLSGSFDQYWNNPLAYPVQSLMTVEEIEALKPAAAVPDDPAVPASVTQTSPPAPNKTTSERTTTSLSGVTTTIPALPDSTDLRLLNWTWAPSVMLVDKPSKIAADADAVGESQDTAVDGLLQLMSQARTDLLIVSPYFVPGEKMMQQFADLRQRGVRVRVLTNSLASNDAPAAHAGYARYRQALLAMGIELYEMHAEQKGTITHFGSMAGSAGDSLGASRASLHAKVVVMDKRLLMVGSMNLDLRSKLQNSEVAIVIRNRTLSAEATRMIEPALVGGAWRVELVDGGLVWRAPQGSTLKDSKTEPDASLGLRLMLKLIGPFAPDEML
ncbi:MAG: phospholipase D family protein [Polaromonas sp.]|uniref:phospholipase D-like domain-containing protein n=1 Tax=Polaromonas sp. TaxID=1869339 RepID=UPI0027315407|nr:phospholipase D family protein [Polaromonas sp.]MDP2256411.1 phospholipase D family protein [Polaromonas sp.]